VLARIPPPHQTESTFRRAFAMVSADVLDVYLITSDRSAGP
jgi:hypothetical protein